MFNLNIRAKPFSQGLGIIFLLLVFSSFQDTSSYLSLNKATNRNYRHLSAKIQGTQGGAKPSYTLSVIQTLDEGFILAGASRIFDSDDSGAIIVKTNKKGVEQWRKNYGVAGIDRINGITFSDDSNILFVGDCYQFKYDICFGEVDQAGELLWSSSFGGSEGDYGHQVFQDAENGYTIMGNTNSFGAGDFDIWVVKTDKARVTKWNQTYGGSTQDLLYSAVKISNGNYLLAGYTDKSSSDLLNTNIYLTRISSDGEIIWSEQYQEGENIDFAYSAIETTDGHFVIAGSAGEQGISAKMVLLKVNETDGSQIWKKTYPSVFEDVAYSVIQASDGGFLLSGEASTVNYENMDIKIIKTDSEGNSEWIKTYNRTSRDNAFSMIRSKDGGYVIAGITSTDDYSHQWPWFFKIDEVGDIQWETDLNGFYTSCISEHNQSISPEISPYYSRVVILGLIALYIIRKKKSTN